MEQNIENQIRILEDTQDQPTRFCFEFPLDVSLFQYFLSKGQQCLTYKQEILLNGLLSGTSLLYKVNGSLQHSLIQASLLGVIQHVINQKKTMKNDGAVLIVSHNITLFQNLVKNFEEIAEQTNITYLIVDQRPKGTLPKADIVILLSTYFQVVLSLLDKPVTLCLSTDIIATKVNLIFQNNDNCQVVGFFTHQNDLQSWNSTQNVEVVNIVEKKQTIHKKAYLSQEEDMNMWILRTILDHFEKSISVVCTTNDQAQEIHAFLLSQGLHSLHLNIKERKYFIDKHIRLLKRRLYDVIVSTEVQKSADIQIILSEQTVASRQQAIFVHRKSSSEQDVVEEQASETEPEDSQDSEIIQEIEDIQSAEEDIEITEADKNDVQEEDVPEKVKISLYDPPTFEQVIARKEKDLFFRLLKKQGFTNGVLYKKLAEEIVEHPQSIQLIATLLQEFDIQILSYDKFEKIDRNKIDQKTVVKPERRTSSKKNTEKRNTKHSRRRNYRRR